MVAVLAGQVKAALRLIKAGADVDAVDDHGHTALYWANVRWMPKVVEAILALPGTPLALARRTLDLAVRVEQQEPEPCLQAAEKFVSAAVEGQDIASHLPRLYDCYHEFPRYWSETRLSLERAICYQVLRGADPAAIDRLERAARSDQDPGIYRGDRPFANGLAFADFHGAELRPLYPLLIETLEGRQSPLDEHLSLHPERLRELSELVAARCREKLPRLLAPLSYDSWATDASPAASTLLRLLRSKDGAVRTAAAKALQTLTKRGRIDLTSSAAELASLIAEGREAQLASELLVRWGVRQRPPDWNTVDHLCLHANEAARQGALRALFWEWTEGEGGGQGTTTRLARALIDPAAAVRGQVQAALAEGRRLQKAFSSVDAAVLGALVETLGTASGAGVGEFLLEYARSDRSHAVELLPVLQMAPDNRIATGLGATCQEIIAGAHAAPCSVCRYLSDRTWWGEEVGGGDRPEPPQFKRLTRLNAKQYRCPECSTYYALQEGGSSFLNADYTDWTLTRMGAAEAEGQAVETHELIRRGDFTGLARTLLHPADGDSRAEAWQTLEAQVAEGLDIAPLVPSLQEVLESGSDDARIAAKVLTRYWLPRGATPEIDALLVSGRLDVRLGALSGIDHAALADPASVGPYLGRIRPLLGSDEKQVRSCAQAILLKAGLQEATAHETVADATRRLDSPRPEERALAAEILSEAARQHAAASAGPSAPKPAALVQTLVEHLRAGKDELESIHALRELLDKGVDISAAFTELGRLAGTQSWAMELLKRAVEKAGASGASVDALLVLGRLKRKPRAAPGPGSTSWAQDHDHVEVRENEVALWGGEGRDSIGSGYPLESFLQQLDVLVGIAERHGPEVLVEVVEAVEARLARR